MDAENPSQCKPQTADRPRVCQSRESTGRFCATMNKSGGRQLLQIALSYKGMTSKFLLLQLQACPSSFEKFADIFVWRARNKPDSKFLCRFLWKQYGRINNVRTFSVHRAKERRWSFRLWSLINVGSIDQPFCAPTFPRARYGWITGPAKCIFHQSESRPPAKYKIQLAEYKIKLLRVLSHGQTTLTSDPAVCWEEDVNHTPKTAGNRANSTSCTSRPKSARLYKSKDKVSISWCSLIDSWHK